MYVSTYIVLSLCPFFWFTVIFFVINVVLQAKNNNRLSAQIFAGPQRILNANETEFFLFKCLYAT